MSQAKHKAKPSVHQKESIAKREWYQKAKANGQQAIYIKQSFNRRKNAALKNRYGITLDQYNQILIAQDNSCAICLKPSMNRALAVDHCHSTGKIRGLLCSSCNQGLGRFKDNVTALKNAVNYLCKGNK